MPDDGVGGDDDAVPGGLGAPAQVDVVAHQGQPAVEPAELFEDIAPDQHAGGGHGQDGPHVVVLPLVLLAAVEAGPAAPRVGDGDADLEELPAVVPAEQLGADDGDLVADLALVLDDAQEFGERVGLGRAVVVQEPQPLLGLAVRQLRHVVGVVAPAPADGVPAAGALEVRQLLRGQHARGACRFVDGLTEASAARQVENALVADRVGDQRGGGVRTAGVGRYGVLYGALLAEQS